MNNFVKDQRTFGPCCHHSETTRPFEAQTAQNVSNRTKRIKVHEMQAFGVAETSHARLTMATNARMKAEPCASAI